MDHLDRPLSPRERQALWAFLGGVAAPAGGLGPEALDGFFTALVLGPRTVMPSEYLPVILGDMDFQSEEEARWIFGYLMRRWNHLAALLMDGQMPALWIFETPKDQKGSAWCRGFMWGARFYRDDWDRLSAEPRFRMYTDSFQTLAGSLQGPFPALSATDRKCSLMFIRDGIRVLHDHWLEIRKREMGTLRVEATRI